MTFKFTFRVDPVGIHCRTTPSRTTFETSWRIRPAASESIGYWGATRDRTGWGGRIRLQPRAVHLGALRRQLCTSSRHSFSIKFPLRIRDGFNTFEFTGWLMRGSASARRTGGGLAGIDHELGVCQMGGGRALQQYTSSQKKSPTICGGADFLPKLGLIFLVGRSRSRGTGVGASIFGTARNKALTLRPVPFAV